MLTINIPALERLACERDPPSPSVAPPPAAIDKVPVTAPVRLALPPLTTESVPPRAPNDAAAVSDCVPVYEPAFASVPPLLVMLLAIARELRSRVELVESVMLPLPNAFTLPALSVPADTVVPAE